MFWITLYTYSHPMKSVRLSASWYASDGMKSRRRHNCSKMVSSKNTLIFGTL